MICLMVDLPAEKTKLWNIDWVAVVLAFVGGAVIAFGLIDVAPSDAWKIGALLLASLCLGLGLATLFHFRSQDRRARDLEAEIRDLDSRAKGLVEEIDRTEFGKDRKSVDWP